MRGILLTYLVPAVMVVGSTTLAACGGNDDVASAPATVPVTTASTLRITTATTAPSTTTTKPPTTTTTAPSTTTTKPPTTTTTAPSTTTTKPPTTTTTAPSTTTTKPPTTTTTAPSTTTTDTSVPVRKVFGWIRSVEEGADGSITVLFDEAEMLTGTDAVTAARNDGVIGPDDELPNDFYIRNPDESTVAFTVSPDAVVTLQACYEQGDCVTTEEVDVQTWLVLVGGEDDPGLDWIWYGAGQLPYELTIDNGVITALHETYLP